jgi:hypothetical protein
MSKYILMILLILTIGCTSHTEFGECVGIMEDRDPKLVYEYNNTNIVVAILFSETLIIPAIVILEELKCPVGKKEKINE